MCRTFCRTFVLIAVVAALAAVPKPTFGLFADTCNARSDFQYLSPQNYYQIGDNVRIEIVLGAGLITGGTQVTINRVRFELDCTSLGVPCPDAGNLISYAGNITSTCGTTWTANSGGGPIPNEVVFSAAPGVVIPAGQQTFCSIQFDVHVDQFPPVGQTIRQSSGFTIPNSDAVCNTPGLLAAGNQSTGELRICNCDDGNACTTEVCDPQLGCIYTPVTCNDSNACTTDQLRPGHRLRLHADHLQRPERVHDGQLQPRFGMRVHPERSVQRQQRLHDGHVRPGDRLRVHAEPALRRPECVHDRFVRPGCGLRVRTERAVQRQQRLHDGHV